MTRWVRRQITTIVGLALLGLSCSEAFAQPARRPMTPKDVLELPVVSDPQIAPDGLRVAYVQRRVFGGAYRTGVWTVDIGTSTPQSRAEPASKPRWSPDSTRLAFLAPAGDKKLAQIHLSNVDGSTPAVTLTDMPGDVSDFAWSAAGDKIALITITPPPAAGPISVVDPRHDDRPVARIHLAAVSAPSGGGAVTSVPITPEGQHVLALAWSPDGSRIAYAARAGATPAAELTTELYMVMVPAGDQPPVRPRRITRNDRTECHVLLACALAWSPRGETIAYLEAAGVHPVLGPTKIRILDAAPDRRPGPYLPDRFGGYVRGAQWTSDGDAIVFWATVGTGRQIYRISRDGRRLDTLTGPDALRGPFTVSRDGQRFGYLKEDPLRPADVHVADLAADKGSLTGERALTNVSREVDALLLGETRLVTWKGTDGRRLEGLVVRPVPGAAPRGPAPLIVHLHGGPDSAVLRGFHGSFGALPHVYAALGYATFFPNFRGSSNYGADFTAANVGDLGGGDARDVVTGIKELVRRGLADPHRVGLQGWSYGGYLAAWLVGHAREHGIRYAAASVGGGLANAISHYSQADLQWARELYHQGTPWRRPANMLERSPVFHLHRARTPTVIFHGRRDERVPVAQALEMYMGLKQTECPLRLVTYDAIHNPTDLNQQRHKIEFELEWFETFLAGRTKAGRCGTPASSDAGVPR